MGKLTVVVPIVAGNGGKYITTSLANVFKSTNGGNISIVDFDVRNPYLAHALTDDRIHGVDNLVEKIDSNLLDKTLFLENMVSLKNGVKLLKGTKLLGRHKIFNIKHAETIIDFLKREYDRSFVSITADADNAFSVSALLAADEIILVSRNNIATIKAFDSVMTMINHYKSSEEPVELIHNMYVQGSKNDVTELINQFNIKVLGTVDYEESTIDNINVINSGLKIFKGKNRNEEQLKEIIAYMQ